ncbi:MAG: alkaline phosphatase [Clostridia bacterium]|nr:alkaline phosphatase [Clostridia bacterium]
MKKFLLILSLLAILLVFASCGSSDYQIVIPENATVTEQYAAENLSAIIEDYFDVKLNIVKDTEKEQKNEILIGETNRDESKTDTAFSQMQFLLHKINNKIVIKGDGIYIGASCGKLVNEHMSVNEGKLIFENLDKRDIYTYQTPEKCDSVIFMIGDGMGDAHISLGEKKRGFSFVAKQFPYKGTSITRSQTVIEGLGTYTDSAASGTAMSTGYKTYNGYLGLDKNGEFIPNVRELAASVGAKTAVLTTDKITGATPSAYLAHNASRENSMELENEINSLIEQNKIDYCLGNAGFALTSETKIALNKISKDKSKFFIMIEEGWIDKQAHYNNLASTADMVQRFNDSIEYATQFALMHPNTALIVTADHETGKLVESTYFKDGFSFMSDEHTNQDVSIFALGAGTECFHGKKVENVELAKFVASVYSNEPFGMNVDELKPAA